MSIPLRQYWNLLADHIKPHFVIYIFEPAIRADISLYLDDELPPAAGGPFVLAWDETGAFAWDYLCRVEIEAIGFEHKISEGV